MKLNDSQRLKKQIKSKTLQTLELHSCSRLGVLPIYSSVKTEVVTIFFTQYLVFEKAISQAGNSGFLTSDLKFAHYVEGIKMDSIVSISEILHTCKVSTRKTVLYCKSALFYSF